MIETDVIAPSVYYFGTPVVLLTTSMLDGSSNITPISSAWALGDSYVLGLGARGQGAINLLRTGEVVVNLPDAALAANIERIASTTGATVVPPHKEGLYRHEPDKWTLGRFTPVPSSEVSPARIQECPVQMEAAIGEVMQLGEDAVAVSVNVLKTHAHTSIVLPGTSHLDLDRWTPLYYTFRHYFAQGERMAVNFRAET